MLIYMKFLGLLNPEHLSEEYVSSFRHRRAARAVVRDTQGMIALLYVSKLHYYKLPGGGIDQGEDVLEALRRECREEIGCEIRNIRELGHVTEYRGEFSLRQDSYCFAADISGGKKAPNMTQKELDEGFEVVWMPPHEAIAKVHESRPDNYEGRFIGPRDSVILKEYETMEG